MSRWLRINEDCIDHPKLLKLPDALRWQWLALLCVASKNGGVLPPIDDAALCLRVPEAKAAEYITKLVKAKLIDQDGDVFVPHNWNRRQFRSDSSTERVKQHRANKRNVSPPVTRNVSSGVTETVTETPPQQSTAETDTQQSTADARALDEMGLESERMLKGLLSAVSMGLGRKPPDMKIIAVWLSEGISTATISAAVTPILKRKADMKSLIYCDAAVREAHARDASPAASSPPLQVVSSKVWVDEGTPEWSCHQAESYRKTNKGTPVTDQKDENGRTTGRRGWYFVSLWPEGYNDFGERIQTSSEEDAA